MKASRGEIKIFEILTEAGLNFQEEYSFPDLISTSGRPLRFDFAIIHNGQLIFIEYDGEQHFKYVPYFHKTKQQFSNAKGRDRHKNNYALAHKIPLYRIPYFEIDNVNSINDLLNPKYRVTSIYHNDRLMH